VPCHADLQCRCLRVDESQGLRRYILREDDKRLCRGMSMTTIDPLMPCDLALKLLRCWWSESRKRSNAFSRGPSLGFDTPESSRGTLHTFFRVDHGLCPQNYGEVHGNWRRKAMSDYFCFLPRRGRDAMPRKRKGQVQARNCNAGRVVSWLTVP
jgi:hypothetical protein